MRTHTSSIFAISALALMTGLTGCGKKTPPPPATTPPATKAVEDTAAPKAEDAAAPKAEDAAAPKAADAAAAGDAAAGDAAAAAPKVVPTTTKSPEAKKEFDAAEALLDNSRDAEGLEHYKKAVELDPEFVKAQVMVGILTPGAEGLAMVEKAAGAAASLPEAERVWVEASLARRKGDEAKAAELLKKVAELAPDDWRAHLAVGRLALMANDIDGAIKALSRAVELDPKNGSLYNQMGYIYLLAGKKDESVAAFTKYVELTPGEANPHDSLAEALLGAGKLAESEAEFRKAIEVSPSFIFAWGGVATCRALGGDWKGAEEALGKWVEGATRAADRREGQFEQAWLMAAHGDVAGADKALTALEQEAGDSEVPVATFAGIDRAIMLMEAQKLDDADKALGGALARGEKAGWAGSELVGAKRVGTAVHAILAARQKKAEDATKLLAELDELVKAVPDNSNAQSLARRTHGQVLLVTDAKAAVAELDACRADDALCGAYEVMAREQAGDKEGAEAAKKALLDTPRRGMFYVYARAMLKTIPEPTK